MTSENNGMIMPVTPAYGGYGNGNDMFGGMSGRRGRDSMGRYTSRDMDPRMSYDDGYSGYYMPRMPRRW